MKFSIIHPSRSRCFKAAGTAEKWLSNYNGYNDAEYIVSLDESETHANKICYKGMFEKLQKHFPSIPIKLVYDNNTNVVQAMNRGAREAEGEILVCVSDDFDCPLNWNDAILKLVDVNKKVALRINQGIEKFKTNIALPILTKLLYDELGYIYYPEYSGMFCDDDLTLVCESLGVLVDAPELLFQHNHYINGRAPIDDTYRRHNNKESWELGKRILEKRKLNNFKC